MKRRYIMYIPLFNKSNYTLLSSLLKIKDIIGYAKKQNISAISIADTNMYGTMEFIKSCEKENIKPIIGLHLILDEFQIIIYAKNRRNTFFLRVQFLQFPVLQLKTHL